MDYKVVYLVALMMTAALTMPYEHPTAVGNVPHAAPKCACAKIYFPLCGSDGNSYNNMCEFMCQKRHVRKLSGIDIQVVKEAKCEETEY